MKEQATKSQRINARREKVSGAENTAVAAGKKQEAAAGDTAKMVAQRPGSAAGDTALQAAGRQQEEKTSFIQASTRQLVSDHDEKVKIGTQVKYTLEQTGAELWPGDKKLSYKWTTLNPDGSARNTKLTTTPTETLVAKVPGTYTIQVELLNNLKPTGSIYSKKQTVYFESKNTELGGLSVGNFDFYFDGSTVIITVRVKFQFEGSIAEADRKVFKTKFFEAITAYWVNSGVSFEAESGNCFVQSIPLTIKCYEDKSDYHKLVDVEKEQRRPKVISDINLYYDIDKESIAHEFGHVLGLYDEYDGGWLENHMFWHDDGAHQKDVNALMNTGSELRQRYFEHYLKEVNTLVGAGCKYKIKAPFK